MFLMSLRALRLVLAAASDASFTPSMAAPRWFSDLMFSIADDGRKPCTKRTIQIQKQRKRICRREKKKDLLVRIAADFSSGAWDEPRTLDLAKNRWKTSRIRNPNEQERPTGPATLLQASLDSLGRSKKKPRTCRSKKGKFEQLELCQTMPPRNQASRRSIGRIPSKNSRDLQRSAPRTPKNLCREPP